MMNPLHWIRWKLLIGLVVVLGGFYFYGLNPLATRQVNDLGAGQLGARWSISNLMLALASGEFNANQLSLATPTGSKKTSLDELKEQVLAADAIQFRADMGQLMRRRYYGEMTIKAPRFQIQRRPDGSINLEDFGGEDDGPLIENPDDWVEAIEQWAEKLKRWDQKRRELQEKYGSKEDETEEVVEDPSVDYARRITYPFANTARYAITRIVGEGLRIEFADETRPKARQIPPLTNGRIEIANLSDNPAHFADPISWTISGEIAGSPMSIVGKIDLREVDGIVKDELTISVDADQLPLQLANVFASKSLPVHFRRGSLSLHSDITIRSFEQIDIRPRMGIHGARVSPRKGKDRIAGLKAADFCKAFNEVGTLEISDMSLTGTFRRPKIHLGSTLKDLVLTSGRQVARKKINAEIDRGEQKLKSLLDEELDDIGGSELLNGFNLRGGVESTKDRLKGRLNGILK